MRTPALLLTTLLLSAPAFAQGGNVAVRAGKLMKADGSILENGSMVIENGRISALGGADLEIPFDVLPRHLRKQDLLGCHAQKIL